MITAQEIATGLRGKRVGKEWRCRCPAHADKKPSLSISEKGGKVLVRCWSGCTQDAVIAALKAQGLWEVREKREEVTPWEAPMPVPLAAEVVLARLEEFLDTAGSMGDHTDYPQVCALLEAAAQVSLHVVQRVLGQLGAAGECPRMLAPRWIEQDLWNRMHEARP